MAGREADVYRRGNCVDWNDSSSKSTGGFDRQRYKDGGAHLGSVRFVPKICDFLKEIAG
jgi:hypothetical protein